MKKCPFCNSEIADDSKFCSYCGKELVSETNLENSENQIKQDDDEKASNGWFVLGFLVSPFIGLALSIVLRFFKPKVSIKCLRGAVGGFIFWAGIYTIFFITAIVLKELKIFDLFQFLFPWLKK